MNKYKTKKYHPYGGSALKPKRKIQTLKRIMNPEVKQIERYETWDQITTGSSDVVPANLPVRGTSSLTRIGDRIQAIGLRVRGSVAQQNTATVATGALRARVMLVRQSNLNNQSFYALSSLLDLSVVTDPTQAGLHPGRNKSVKILRDQVFELDKSNGQVWNYDWFIKLNDIITLSGNSGVYTDSTNIGYFLYIICGLASNGGSQDGIVTTEGIQLTYIDV